MSIKPEKIITDNEKNLTFTDFNNKKIPWRLYTTYIYHDNQVVSEPQYLEKVTTNNLYIESSGSDIKLLVKPANTIQLLGNVNMTNNLLVLGETSLNNLEISQNLLVLGNSNFNNNVTISQNLDSSNILTKDISISNILYLNNSKISDSVGQTGNRKEVLTINSIGNIEWEDISGIDNLNVYRDVSFGNAEISKNLIVYSNANFNNIEISQNFLTIGDASFLNNVEISSNLLVKTDASFSNNVEISKNLSTMGDASFISNVEISNNLLVNNNAIFNNIEISSNLLIEGLASLASVEISENLIVNSNATFVNTVDISYLNINTSLDISSKLYFRNSSVYDCCGNTGNISQVLTKSASGLKWQDIAGTDNLTSNRPAKFSRLEITSDASFSQDVEISQNLIVLGDTSFSQDVEISGNLLVLGDSSFSRDVAISQNLLVIGDSSFSQDVEISGNLLVIGDSSFSQNLEISNNLIVQNNSILYKLYVSNDTTLSQLYVTNDTSLSRLYVTNDTSLSQLYVTSDTSLSRLYVVNDTSLSRLYVADDTSLSRLYVANDTSLSRLYVSSDTSLSRLYVADDTSLSRLYVENDAIFSNNIEISNNLLVLGDTSLNRLDISQNLLVLGDSSLKQLEISQNLIVLGDSSFSNVEISNNLLVLEKCTFRQDIDVGRNLSVLGDSSLNHVEISQNLLVLGDCSLNQVEISQNLIVLGDASFVNNVDISNNIYMRRAFVSNPTEQSDNVDSGIANLFVYQEGELRRAHNSIKTTHSSNTPAHNDELYAPNLKARHARLTDANNITTNTQSTQGSIFPLLCYQDTEIKHTTNAHVYVEPNGENSILNIRRLSTREITMWGRHDMNLDDTGSSNNSATNLDPSGSGRLLVWQNGQIRLASTRNKFTINKSANNANDDSMVVNNLSVTRIFSNLGNNSGQGRMVVYSTGSELKYSSSATTYLRIMDDESSATLNIPYISVNNTAFATSDDRVKHNEIDITDNLHIIRQLQPKLYKKTTEMYAPDYNGDISGHYSIELGLIAQDILKIPDLSFCVEDGDYTDSSGNLVERKYVLSYNNIFVAHIAATKQLDKIVQDQSAIIIQQQDEINNLKNENLLIKNENSLIKAALNQLLADASYALI